MRVTLRKTRIRSGEYEGLLTAQAPEDYAPEIEVLHLGEPVGQVVVLEDRDRPQTWILRIGIPAAVISEGVNTLVIRDRASDQELDRITFVTGEPLEDDIRAEVELLRAELDLLKKAFRQHCLETAGTDAA